MRILRLSTSTVSLRWTCPDKLGGDFAVASAIVSLNLLLQMLPLPLLHKLENLTISKVPRLIGALTTAGSSPKTPGMLKGA